MTRVGKISAGMIVAALSVACGSETDGDGGAAGSGGGGGGATLALVACPDSWHSNEGGLASQSNCRFSDDCANETKFARLQIHAALDTPPAPGDFPVVPYSTTPEVGTTRAFYVPDAANPGVGEMGESGTVTVTNVAVANGVPTSVDVTVDVPFPSGRLSGSFTCTLSDG